MLWAKVHILLSTFPYLDQQIFEISYKFMHFLEHFGMVGTLHYFHIHMISLFFYLEVVMSFRVHGYQSFISLDPCGSHMAYIPQKL